MPCVPLVFELTYECRTPEDMISMASQAHRIEPRQLFKCLEWCVDEHKKDPVDAWVDAFASLIKREEATENFHWDIETTCVSRIFATVLKQDDPNLRFIELIVKRVDYKTFGLDGGGFTFLHIAILRKKLKVVDFLLDKFHFNMNAPNKQKWSPLHVCFQLDNIDWDDHEDEGLQIAKLVLQHPDIDFTLRDVNGLAAFDCATELSYTRNGSFVSGPVKLVLQDQRFESSQGGARLSRLLWRGVLPDVGDFMEGNFSLPNALLQWEEDRISASEQCLSKVGLPDDVIPRVLSFVFPSGLVSHVTEDGLSISQQIEYYRKYKYMHHMPHGISWEDFLEKFSEIYGENFVDADWQRLIARFRAFEKRVEKFEQFRNPT